MALLPSGYTKLEYIESSGTQYIDTGVSNFRTQSTRVTLDVDWLSGLGYYFGCAQSGLSWYVEAFQPTKVYSGYLDESESADIATVIGRYTVDKNGVSTNVNGVKIQHASADSSASIPICLLACGGSSGGVRYCGCGKNLFVQDLFRLNTYQAVCALQKFLR